MTPDDVIWLSWTVDWRTWRKQVSRRLKWKFARGNRRQNKNMSVVMPMKEVGSVYGSLGAWRGSSCCVETMSKAGYAIRASQEVHHVRANIRFAIERLNHNSSGEELGILSKIFLEAFDLILIWDWGQERLSGGERRHWWHRGRKSWWPRPRPPFPPLKGLFQKADDF